MNKVSMLCLVLTESSIDGNIKFYQKYSDYCDILELRADFLAPEEWPKIHSLPSQIRKPIILTFRKPADGGHFKEGEALRIQLMRKALEGAFQYIDLEEDFSDNDFEAHVRKKGVTIIRSFHDFTGIPHELAQRIRKLPRNAKEIPKAAVMANTTEDLLSLFEAAEELGSGDRIILAMGSFGFPSRVLAVKLGSMLTYSSDSKQQAAPGQLDPESLAKIYNFKSITSETEIYGIIGNPVMHSLSPKIHNRGFRMLNLPKIYVPFQVDNLEHFFKLARVLNIRGFSVTIPHKENVRKYLHQSDEGVEKIGACNTVVLSPANQWTGYNTDAMGFLLPLKKQFQGTLKNRRATVIGAGGGAKAVCFALKKEGMEILVVNRTKARADELAREWQMQSAGLDEIERIKDYSDVIVQTTSMGMAPLEKMNPLEAYHYSGHEMAYDIVYKPPLTLFLEQAQKAGCSILNGESMLKEQAYLQFKAFTGQEYPDPLGLTLF
ncbi:MAG: shikimate dehydrogenase [Spirochaetales bacterium]|nr:shikimate dehydrogenase [Spirochaetales bacterium]